MNKIRRNGKLYTQLLLGLTFCIILVLVASSTVYYFIFTRILQNEAFEYDLSNLRQTGNTVVKTTENAQTVAFQIYRNSAITKMMYYSEPDAFDTQAAMLNLRSYLSAMPFIQSIYVYNPASETFYIAAQSGQEGIWREDEIVDTSILDILGNYQVYKPFTPIPRIMATDSQTAAGIGVYTFLCYDAIGFDRKINSAVIVNISASWINKELGNSQNDSNGRTFLVDDHHSVLASEDLTNVKLGDADLALLEQLVPKKQSGFQVANFQNHKALITYMTPTPYEWHYVRITPYKEITDKTMIIRTRTLQIAGGVLIVGLLLSLLMSRYLYLPINKIENRMSDLESERRDSSYTLRQNMLRKLIQIHDINPQLQLEKLRRAGIHFDFTKPYRLAYLRIDQFDHIRKRSHKDMLTYKFAIMNIGTEVCSKQYQVESVDLEDDGILMLINTFEGGSPQPDSLFSMLKDIQNACMEYIHIGITIALTPVSENPQGLNSHYKLAKEASNQRFFLGRGALIQAAEQPHQAKYSFCVGKERAMVEELMAGKTSEATALFREIVNETAGHSFQDTMATATHIALTLSNTLAEMEKNSGTRLNIGSELTIPSIDHYETLDEMTEAVHLLFEAIKAKIFEKRSSKQEDLIRKINGIIETRYNDPNLSLNLVSEELKMSTYHVSRVYRQLTLTNIVDAINSVRIDNAKALLLQTEKPVTEIAERTGFTNSSYFHRMFKKTTGVTPAEFRKANA
ncbi:AraC family transcriptional regulator [Gorillibacterium massiliense]|uniref:AraC family transcriptional regulator n=1 Tax=Gorillibacterium massiliense TaxID=1280390 RepID=UPI00138E355F|nr:AraC family transcriptional regulator [Gorillibacterium massiliense]